MKKKSDNNKSKHEMDGQSDIDHVSAGAYEVEEQVFDRGLYENTSSFEMDIEKAKAMAATGQPITLDESIAEHVVTSDTGERDAIKRSLAELREVEQKIEYDGDEYDEAPGLLRRIKNLFTH